MKHLLLSFLFLSSTITSIGQYHVYKPNGDSTGLFVVNEYQLADKVDLGHYRTEKIGENRIAFVRFSDSALYLLSKKRLAPDAVKGVFKSYRFTNYLKSFDYRYELGQLFQKEAIDEANIKNVFGEPDYSTLENRTGKLTWFRYNLTVEFLAGMVSEVRVYDHSAAMNAKIGFPAFTVTGTDYSIGFEISVDNWAQKTIKYAYFTVDILNAVDDKLATKTLTGVGPVEFGGIGSWNFESVLFSKSADKIILKQVKILYKDGTTRTLLKDQISSLRGRRIYPE